MKRLKHTITLLTMLVILLTCTSIKAYAQGPKEVIEDLVILHISDVSDEFDIDPYILASLIYQESRFIVTDNLTQITNPKWFQLGIEYTGNDDLTNPYNNIRICGFYLNMWQEEHSIEECLVMWNSGHFAPTSKYSQEIIRRANKWREKSLDIATIVASN